MAPRAIRPLTLTTTEAAYLAGLMDGEGCFTMLRQSPMVMLQMTDETIVRDLGTVLDVAVVKINRRADWKDVYSIRLYGRRAQQLCEHLLPFLRIKRRHAELILAWPYGVLDRAGIPRGARITVVTAVAERRAEIVAELRNLNRRGRH